MKALTGFTLPVTNIDGTTMQIQVPAMGGRYASLYCGHLCSFVFNASDRVDLALWDRKQCFSYMVPAPNSKVALAAAVCVMATILGLKR